MVTRFGDHSTNPTRALQAWLILIGRARNRQTLTYKTLIELMQFSAPPVALGPILDYILKYCQLNGLPPLTVIVVRKDTGAPGSGMGEYSYSQQEEVFEFDWYSIVPPTPEELDAALKQG